MLKAATVSFFHEDAFRAGREAARELLDELGAPPDLVLLFASAHLDPERVLAGVAQEIPPEARLVGCSSCAEIDGNEALTGSVTLMGIALGAVRCETFRLEGPVDDPAAAGRAFGERVRAFDPAVVFLFPDGLALNHVQFLQAMQETLGASLPIVGGVPSDMAQFVRTTEFEGRSAFSGGVVAAALSGPVDVVTGARAGFQPVGSPRTCTRVEGGRRVLELDGEPALSIYRHYLGPRAAEMPEVGIEFPLGIVGGTIGNHRLPASEAISLIRAVSGVDEASDALLCLGEMPEGARVCMTRATKEDLLRAAEEACDAALLAMPRPEVAFFFDCMGRKLVLGSRYKEEIRRAFARLGDDVPKVGFYTYGEISPVGGVTMYHDQTFTVALLAERS
ncbi:FIST signal transduction protein [Polyangium aurulentum]|uniref:FIST signal transduction protein n=1 Tax=Polyangium aurulentum TaxID=2567896 RepID=UPI0010AE3992|nr:FIST N-terminal domain-containing protein [Polyangium aurulentum]UQA55011.1 FIST C-terminal domain-containing protein [Polyangium aurulentum]